MTICWCSMPECIGCCETAAIAGRLTLPELGRVVGKGGRWNMSLLPVLCTSRPASPRIIEVIELLFMNARSELH